MHSLFLDTARECLEAAVIENVKLPTKKISSHCRGWYDHSASVPGHHSIVGQFSSITTDYG